MKREKKITEYSQNSWLWSQNYDFGFKENPQQNNNTLPKVSIVTPSFNQGQFIEETIRSVLLQGYPNLEYIIIDGGSTDNTIDIIKKYEKHITYWVSEPDKGQSDAINKGFNIATGQIFGWMNSDDYFTQGAIQSIIKLREQNIDYVGWVGACQLIDINSKGLNKKKPIIGTIKQFANWKTEAWIAQPSCLFDADIFTKIGGVDESLEYVMDVDLWMRMAEHGKFATTDKTISCARIYEQIKTLSNTPMQQAEHIFICFKNGIPEVAQERMNKCMEFAVDRWKYRKLLKYFLKRTNSWLKQLILYFIRKL